MPQALFSTLSQPSAPIGQVRLPSNPQRFRVIEPVSISPAVASTAMAMRAHLAPES